MTGAEIERIDLGEFRALGFLQEINRRVLHPAGLALEMGIDEAGCTVFGGVWDYRDDAEGIVYEGIDLTPLAASVDAEIAKHATVRRALLGDVIQPVGE